MGLLIRNGVVYSGGADGKSAYEQAVEGGHQGTEAEFKTLLASIPELNDRIEDAEQATTAATVGPAPIVTFDASAADMPLKQVVVDIGPVQSGSGDPSPTNVRPISGWTGANISLSGKNFANSDSVNENITNTGTVEYSRVARSSKYYIPVSSNTEYVLSTNASVNGLRVSEYDQNKNFIRRDAVSNNSVVTFIPNAETKYIRWTVNYDGSTTFTQEMCDALQIQFEIGNSRTAFEPFNLAVDITFPDSAGTVYGGTLDLVNGVLTVNQQLLDMSSIVWSDLSTSSGARFRTMPQNIKYSDARTLKILCTCYASNVGGAAYDDKTIYNARDYIYVIDSDYSGNLSGFIASLSGQYCVIPLENPIVYNLSDIPDITTILGTNNLWADCGDVTVTYGAYLETLKASLDRTNGELDTLRACIAPIEDGDTASQAYSQGAYFFRNGQFCTALTAISCGAAFTLGTNYQTSTVAAALIALQS